METWQLCGARRGRVIVNLLAGSLVGAWVGANWATMLSSQTLYRIIAVLLAMMAVVLLWGHDLDGGQAWFIGAAQVIAAVAAGLPLGSWRQSWALQAGVADTYAYVAMVLGKAG